jgi:CheY-like chemotaxis protein
VETSDAGTLFRVSLPAAVPGTAAEAGVPARPPAPAARRGKVLVIDDEPLIAKAVERTLGRDHDVVCEVRAQDALKRLVAGERFDVILCDVMMPEMSGLDFHRELTRLVPEQLAAMAFLTGGAFTPRARDFLDETACPRIDKPFESASLRSFVAKLVG